MNFIPKAEVRSSVAGAVSQYIKLDGVHVTVFVCVTEQTSQGGLSLQPQ